MNDVKNVGMDIFRMLATGGILKERYILLGDTYTPHPVYNAYQCLF